MVIDNMKTGILRLTVQALVVLLLSSVSHAQLLADDQFGRHHLTLLDRQREPFNTGLIHLQGPMTFAISAAELGTKRLFLRFGPAAAPAANFELLDESKVTIKATHTNDLIQLGSVRGALHLSNTRHTKEGSLEVAVTTQGNRFVLTSNEVVVERVIRSESE